MSSMTPIRVRGKRSAPKDQKWHSGKQRKIPRSSLTTESEANSSARSTPSAGAVSRRRRKARDVELSQLEQLPTEILQAIFQYSANVDLPLASRRLASQLDSHHLYHSLTSITLASLFKRPTPVTEAERQASMRLMNSKFFTWPFFKSWIKAEFEQQGLFRAWDCHCKQHHTHHWDLELRPEWRWTMSWLVRGILPPPKLLHGPFTRDKTKFLSILAMTCQRQRDRLELSPAYAEQAREGLREAVSEGARDAVEAFWWLGMEPDTELLREAVLDSTYDSMIVRSIVRRAVSPALTSTAVDFLDPAIWAWAERAQESRGDAEGYLLKGLLKDAAQEVERKAQQKTVTTLTDRFEERGTPR